MKAILVIAIMGPNRMDRINITLNLKTCFPISKTNSNGVANRFGAFAFVRHSLSFARGIGGGEMQMAQSRKMKRKGDVW